MQQMLCRRVMLKDSHDVLQWRNDPTTRAMSLNQEIISETEHLAWFSKMLNNKLHLGIVGEINREKIGVVFFQINNYDAFVSINLNPEHRGKNLAVKFLDSALREVKILLPGVCNFKAEVKNNNKTSIKVFAKNGFSIEREKDGFRVYSVQSKFAGVIRDNEK